MLKYTGIAHASLVVLDLTMALEFYCDILEFERATNRPDLGYPGCWLNIGAQQIHLLELPNPDPTDGRPQHVGHDRHTAITINNIDLLKQRLDLHGIKYTISRSGRKALFCRDRDGNGLEFIQL